MWLAEETQGDEGAAKLQEGHMGVSPVLVADLQAPEAVEPGERPFDQLDGSSHETIDSHSPETAPLPIGQPYAESV